MTDYYVLGAKALYPESEPFYGLFFKHQTGTIEEQMRNKSLDGLAKELGDFFAIQFFQGELLNLCFESGEIPQDRNQHPPQADPGAGVAKG